MQKFMTIWIFNKVRLTFLCSLLPPCFAWNENQENVQSSFLHGTFSLNKPKITKLRNLTAIFKAEAQENTQLINAPSVVFQYMYYLEHLQLILNLHSVYSLNRNIYSHVIVKSNPKNNLQRKGILAILESCEILSHLLKCLQRAPGIITLAFCFSSKESLSSTKGSRALFMIAEESFSWTCILQLLQVKSCVERRQAEKCQGSKNLLDFPWKIRLHFPQVFLLGRTLSQITFP